MSFVFEVRGVNRGQSVCVPLFQPESGLKNGIRWSCSFCLQLHFRTQLTRLHPHSEIANSCSTAGRLSSLTRIEISSGRLYCKNVLPKTAFNKQRTTVATRVKGTIRPDDFSNSRKRTLHRLTLCNTQAIMVRSILNGLRQMKRASFLRFSQYRENYQS